MSAEVKPQTAGAALPHARVRRSTLRGVVAGRVPPLMSGVAEATQFDTVAVEEWRGPGQMTRPCRSGA